jgi:heptaprenyl diphosphate synthase
LKSGIDSRKLALAAMLTAVAAVLGVLERFLPLQALVPLPGVKLGLANIVTLFALFFLDIKTTLAIVVARCILGALMSGGPTGFLFSLSGSLLALFAMALFKVCYNRVFSLYGISMAGAAAHNIGQVLCAMAILGDPAILSYLPTLLFSGLATGALTAAAAAPLLKRMSAAGAIGGTAFHEQGTTKKRKAGRK